MTSRDPFMPRPVQRTGPALSLALLAHVLLIAALAFGVNWHTSEPTTVAAELWSAVPQAAAPRAVEPPPPPPVAPPKPTPAPVVKPEPTPTPAPVQPDPQIAIEKAKREEAKRVQAEEEAREKAEKAKRAKEELARKQAEADKLAKAKADAEKADKLAKEKADKAEAAKQAAARDAYLKRMQGMAGATGGATDTGSALRSSAPSADYAGRIAARIKPNILFGDPIDGNPVATVEVRLAPDGTITGKRLLKSSGVKAWDDAVLRAVDRTEILPRDTDGRVRSPVEISFRPHD
jgi:colicin import membrane protein